MGGLAHLASTSGALLLGLGGFAYFRSQSLPSLIGGAALASIHLGSAYLLSKPDKVTHGCILGTTAGTLTCLLGLRRLAVAGANKKLVPLTLVVVGLINAGYYGIESYKWLF